MKLNPNPSHTNVIVIILGLEINRRRIETGERQSGDCDSFSREISREAIVRGIFTRAYVQRRVNSIGAKVTGGSFKRNFSGAEVNRVSSRARGRGASLSLGTMEKEGRQEGKTHFARTYVDRTGRMVLSRSQRHRLGVFFAFHVEPQPSK